MRRPAPLKTGVRDMAAVVNVTFSLCKGRDTDWQSINATCRTLRERTARSRMRSRLADKTYLQYIYNQIYSVILQKGYTPLKSRELEELPRFRVMSWQPFQLPWSASLCK